MAARKDDPKPAPASAEPEKKGFFSRLKDKTKAILKGATGFITAATAKTRDTIAAVVRKLTRTIDEDTLEEMEDALLQADFGPQIALDLVDAVRKAYKGRKIGEAELMGFLRSEIRARLTDRPNALRLQPEGAGPTVILVCGVNGVGKTTSIAKLAHHLHNVEGKKVIVAAGDTFRAAAVEQLTVWAERIGCEIVKQQTGADAASVAYQACDAAIARKADFLIVDTAGRLHTQRNLMDELEKITRVIGKRIDGAPHEVILVLDATTGQNAVIQAEKFKETAKVTGLFVAKLDGTAKGGVVLQIHQKMDVPVKFVGLGEKIEAIAPFDVDTFLDGIFGKAPGADAGSDAGDKA
jgi:fused signal recognition particle receptor